MNASSTNCCVIDCPNNYGNTERTVKFYSFPGRPHEKERRLRWISAVRGTDESNGNGRNWEPKRHSRLCSQHFVGNAKSMDPRKPSYIPTIFGYNTNMYNEVRRYKKRERRSTQHLERQWSKAALLDDPAPQFTLTLIKREANREIDEETLSASSSITFPSATRGEVKALRARFPPHHDRFEDLKQEDEEEEEEQLQEIYAIMDCNYYINSTQFDEVKDPLELSEQDNVRIGTLASTAAMEKEDRDLEGVGLRIRALQAQIGKVKKKVLYLRGLAEDFKAKQDC